MLLKRRSESYELLAMRSLNKRMELSKEDKYYYTNLEKGYEGEVKFDQMAECLNQERYIIDDLLLKVNNSYFQIDKLIITQTVIQLLDIKNFEGDYYLASDKFYSVKTNKEYKNPLDQLKRSTTLFHQLLQNIKLDYLIDPSVIFVNPEFSLYQAPMDQPFILPTQVNRFLTNSNQIPSKLTDGHKKLAQTLLSLHQTKNPYTILPEYDYYQLRPGTTCSKCGSFSISVVGKRSVCKECGYEEWVSTSLIRSVNELKLLFPEIKLTTNVVYEWCGGIISKKRIAATLAKNYRIVGVHQWAYYE